jgi:hypothetical protein
MIHYSLFVSGIHIIFGNLFCLSFDDLYFHRLCRRDSSVDCTHKILKKAGGPICLQIIMFNILCLMRFGATSSVDPSNR